MPQLRLPLAIGLVGVGFVVAWLVLGAPLPSRAHGSGVENDVPVPADMRVRVETKPAVSGDFPVHHPFVGVVAAAPGASVTISSRSGGRVLSLATAGGAVKAGETILEFDPAPRRAAVAEARAALEAAENAIAAFDRFGRSAREIELSAAADKAAAAAAIAAAHAERLSGLAGDGLASEKQIAEAKALAAETTRSAEAATRAVEAFRSAGADLERATLAAAAESARFRLEDDEAVLAGCSVRAPFAGRLTALTVRPGDRVEPDGPIGSLLSAEGRVLRFGVPPSVARGLAPGAPARWAVEGRERAGRVVIVEPEVSPTTGLVTVVAEPDAGAPADEPGLVVRGGVETGRLSAATIVPEAALVRAGDRTSIAVVEDGSRARVVFVRVLASHDGLVAVEGSVRPGDRVIVSGAYNLPDGAGVVEGTPAPVPDPAK